MTPNIQTCGNPSAMAAACHARDAGFKRRVCTRVSGTERASGKRQQAHGSPAEGRKRRRARGLVRR